MYNSTASEENQMWSALQAHYSLGVGPRCRVVWQTRNSQQQAGGEPSTPTLAKPLTRTSTTRTSMHPAKDSTKTEVIVMLIAAASTCMKANWTENHLWLVYKLKKRFTQILSLPSYLALAVHILLRAGCSIVTLEHNTLALPPPVPLAIPWPPQEI